ncbi:GH32 C-terminal domain-containing protein [Streptomyces sp. NBC_00576]|uniref:GH32 C-terminal domain-containing protein n=1 Tax=Streptomyces sp. NBC_00576 TaxID=2903665 RepID=UPI002E8027E4|nr:GH32 C-terminal domain-containing protein [Streptomyces sp. NBC_00576]WUB68941.1 GH32 C-terminal domain-containing protein [Streptomyces sp. NBC_00576]
MTWVPTGAQSYPALTCQNDWAPHGRADRDQGHGASRRRRIAGPDPVEPGQVSRTFDLTATLIPDPTGTTGLRLVTSADDTEYLDVSLDPTAGRLTVDRGHASLDVRARTGAYSLACPAAKEPGTPVELRVVVDRSIAEIYLATGQVLTLRFYPVGDRPWRLQAHGTGSGAGDFTVEAWDLDPGRIHQQPHL